MAKDTENMKVYYLVDQESGGNTLGPHRVDIHNGFRTVMLSPDQAKSFLQSKQITETQPEQNHSDTQGSKMASQAPQRGGHDDTTAREKKATEGITRVGDTRATEKRAAAR